MVFYPPHFELPKRKSNKNSPINSVSPEVASCGSLTPFIEFSATPAVFRSCFTAVKLKKTTILTLYLSIYLSIYRFKVHVFAKVCLYSVQLLRITPNIILFSFIVAHFSTKCLGSNTMWTEYKNQNSRVLVKFLLFIMLSISPSVAGIVPSMELIPISNPPSAYRLTSPRFEVLS